MVKKKYTKPQLNIDLYESREEFNFLSGQLNMGIYSPNDEYIDWNELFN